MAITLELLEKVVISEVENLHIRVDSVVSIIENIGDRLGTLERQISTVFMAIDELSTRVKHLEMQVGYIKENMVTKADLSSFVTKTEVREIVEEVVERVIIEAFKKYLPNPGA